MDHAFGVISRDSFSNTRKYMFFYFFLRIILFIENKFLTSLSCFCTFDNCPGLYGSVSGLSILFHLAICLFLHQCYTVMTNLV